MFVRPEQIAEVGRRHPELGRLRLVVSREGETDVMTLKTEGKNRRQQPARGRLLPHCARSPNLAGLSN